MTQSAPGEHVLGIDVGTGSARAGIFDLHGRLLGHATRPFETQRPQAEFCEQSSQEIWDACGAAVREALSTAAVAPESVVGLSVDATSCSLVFLEDGDRPLSISSSGDARWNVILWMDHRAIAEADFINQTGHEVLRHVGGKLSPEMAPAKLLWVKRNLPEIWKRITRCVDLADYLTYRSTGRDVRSMCTTVCKWTYLAHREEGGWATDLFESIGLEDVVERDLLGSDIRPMGSPIGGLDESAAEHFGLVPGTPVGVGIIDAHAGGLGLLGAALQDPGDPLERLEHALALIGGTSSCHMAVSRESRFIEGIWGPYYSAMVPGMWLSEGGQAASGSLIDHVMRDAAAWPELEDRARAEGQSVYEILNTEIGRLARLAGSSSGELTRDLHILPYHHGNRSPRADPGLRGVAVGLSLGETISDLALGYLAAIHAVALGTRHIIETLNSGGYEIDTVLVCGGGTKNPLWLQEHADITGCRLHLPREPEAVLLGSAILAAVASGRYPDLPRAMRAMGGSERIIEPNTSTRSYHDKKYDVFLRMYEQFMELREMMALSDAWRKTEAAGPDPDGPRYARRGGVAEERRLCGRVPGCLL